MDSFALISVEASIQRLEDIQKALYPIEDIERLSRKKGGKGLVCIENCVEASIQRLEDHSKGLISDRRHRQIITKKRRKRTRLH